MANWLPGEVVANKHWTDTLYSLRVKVANYPSFTPGQFTRIALDLEGERVARPYSLVNAPHEDVLEFYSITLDEGILSPRLHGLQTGERLYVSDLISGFLVLDEVPREHTQLWLMATGTGLGPFLSILKTAEPWRRFDRLVLVHAVRHTEELTYRATIDQLLAQHAKLQYIPFVSRQETNFALGGRIPAALTDGRLEERAQLSMHPANTHLMLCGNPAMLKDVQAVMAERGFKRNRRRDPGQITTENYW